MANAGSRASWCSTASSASATPLPARGSRGLQLAKSEGELPEPQLRRVLTCNNMEVLRGAVSDWGGLRLQAGLSGPRPLSRGAMSAVLDDKDEGGRLGCAVAQEPALGSGLRAEFKAQGSMTVLRLSTPRPRKGGPSNGAAPALTVR
jgi:hypothetical protein